MKSRRKDKRKVPVSASRKPVMSLRSALSRVGKLLCKIKGLKSALKVAEGVKTLLSEQIAALTTRIEDQKVVITGLERNAAELRRAKESLVLAHGTQMEHLRATHRKQMQALSRVHDFELAALFDLLEGIQHQVSATIRRTEGERVSSREQALNLGEVGMTLTRALVEAKNGNGHPDYAAVMALVQGAKPSTERAMAMTIGLLADVACERAGLPVPTPAAT